MAENTRTYEIVFRDGDMDGINGCAGRLQEALSRMQEEALAKASETGDPGWSLPGYAHTDGQRMHFEAVGAMEDALGILSAIVGAAVGARTRAEADE